MMLVQSPNGNIRPASASVNALGHLVIGGCDTVELAKQFGTPLWVMDEQTILSAIESYKQGLSAYSDSLVLYAGKAFLCLAMCHIVRQQGIGLDVVSLGELQTAIEAGIAAERIFMHGNNKSAEEVAAGLAYGAVNIVCDNESELHMVAKIAKTLGTKANLLFRVIPGVEPETHQHIITGHFDSKFGIALEDVAPMIRIAQSYANSINVLGLHAHIGSQACEIEPYYQYIQILAQTYSDIKRDMNLQLTHLDIGGGLGISYTDNEKPVSIEEWTRGVSNFVRQSFSELGLALPKLFIEPGRSIVGTAGVTLYRAGHKKHLPNGTTYLAVDGGMADNPRPITYQAKYSACVANRANEPAPAQPLSLVGKYCESGDIIIKEAPISAESGDLIAVFGTGAYNFSMASNYNRTARPACVLVKDGKADVIVERETADDLLRHDRVPDRFKR